MNPVPDEPELSIGELWWLGMQRFVPQWLKNEPGLWAPIVLVAILVALLAARAQRDRWIDELAGSLTVVQHQALVGNSYAIDVQYLAKGDTVAARYVRRCSKKECRWHLAPKMHVPSYKTTTSEPGLEALSAAMDRYQAREVAGAQ